MKKIFENRIQTKYRGIIIIFLLFTLSHVKANDGIVKNNDTASIAGR